MKHPVAILAGCLLLAGGAVVSQRWPGEASGGRGLEVLELRRGQAAVAWTGRARLPEAFDFYGEGSPTLRVVDEAGQNYVVHGAQIHPGEVRFRVSSGYPPPSGRAKLQLVQFGKIVASTDLGTLPDMRESFAVVPTAGIRAVAEASYIVIEFDSEKGPSDSISLRPIRTEHRRFGTADGSEMTKVRPGTLRAAIATPYAGDANQIEVEIQIFRNDPDEFTFDGGVLSVTGGVGALGVVRSSEVRSRQGRLVRIPPQYNTVSSIGSVVLSLEVLETAMEWNSPPSTAAVVSPKPTDLGLRRLSAVVHWPSDAGPIRPRGGGAGLPGPQFETPFDPNSIRIGPTGPIRVELPPNRPDRKETKRFAIPIEHRD